VFELLEYDGEPTPTLELYPSCSLYLSPEKYVKEAEELVERVIMPTSIGPASGRSGIVR